MHWYRSTIASNTKHTVTNELDGCTEMCLVLPFHCHKLDFLMGSPPTSTTVLLTSVDSTIG